MKKYLVGLLLVMVCLVLVGCGSTKKGIVGKWKHESSDYTYNFKSDGTGTYSYGSSSMEFTYEIEENQISITYKGNTIPFTTRYTIDGDKLNIIDSFGSDTIYKRVK